MELGGPKQKLVTLLLSQYEERSRGSDKELRFLLPRYDMKDGAFHCFQRSFWCKKRQKRLARQVLCDRFTDRSAAQELNWSWQARAYYWRLLSIYLLSIPWFIHTLYSCFHLFHMFALLYVKTYCPSPGSFIVCILAFICFISPIFWPTIFQPFFGTYR